MTSQTTAPAIIHKLVETFEQNLDSYRFSKNETELRRQFLDPFFTALGWDVANEKGYDELGKEVTHEFSVDVAGQQKKADYAFRVGRGEKFDFLVEAKKPSVKIESSQDAAFQIRRYGWSAKLPINILSDFEHFAVYDCRTKPSYNDKASMGRIMLIHYKDYVSRWNEIVEIFSPEAVRKGSFAKYAESMKGKKGTADVDDAFLQEIERWRELLAKNIALRNDDIDIAGLNYSVQMTIDRIVFLRICEERGIEPENQLLEITNTDKVYEELCELFKRADTKYNSGLFHFKAEKEQNSRHDDLTLSLDIDDKILKDIISNLYYPKSPYAFLYIPSDILGQVYERFLGKVIRLTDGHKAKVEEKPEVRKAGGVFYTPTYIVEYIVKNTVGKLVENKSPKDIASLKIVDPACGSGTFLLGAYQFLLDWHLNWYSENEPEKAEKNKAVVKVGDGYRLSTAKKKEILLNNIHGVDIDAQAVEVTKLSLLLKVLENASGQLGLGMERVLPDLGNNIKCGNSLIGFDYFEGQLLPDEEERNRVNPFNWNSEFKEVFAKGGFDVVIGNPPYVRMETFKEIKDYLRSNYSCHEERSDIYAYIMERAHKVLKSSGLFGMIISNKFLRANYGKPLREFIQKNASVNRVVDFAGLPVFKGATVRTIVLLTSREAQKETLQYSPPLSMDIYTLVESEKMPVEKAIEGITYLVSGATLAKDTWNFAQQDADDLLNRLAETTTPLVKYCDGLICMGIKSGLTEAFVINTETRAKIIKENPKAAEVIKPFLNGRDIRRYALEPKDIYLLYTYRGVNIGDYPAVENHLKPFKEQLKKRATKQEWFELQQSQYAYLKYFESPKIVFPDIATAPRFVLDKDGHFGSNTMYFIPRHDLYLLSLLNSKLATFYFRKVCAGLEGKNETYLRFFGQYLEGFPVANADKKQQDKMVMFAEQMMELNKRLAKAKTPQEKESLERQIQETDFSIDSFVYDLYGLNEEEIKIIEGE